MVWGIMGMALKPVLGLAQHVAPKYQGPAPTVLPVPLPPVLDTSFPDLDRAIAELDAHAWVLKSTREKANLMRACSTGLVNVSKQVSDLSERYKGSWGNKEEWLAMFCVVLGCQEYVTALESEGAPAPLKLRKETATDQWVAEVFPHGMLKALLPGYKGEVWMKPGTEPTQGAAYRAPKEGEVRDEGHIALVLGAGNQYPVVLLDIFHKLICDMEVVVCKISPINHYLGPVFEEALSPLIKANALRIVYGGREVGEYLVKHPKVHSIHLTGSADTCNAIVWGSPTVPRVGVPPIVAMGKSITAELGNVTPFIIVPGPWTDAEIRHVAAEVVGGFTHNAGHNCIALEVLITAADWPLREKFLAEVHRLLNERAQRVPYYPGSAAKHAAFRERFKAGPGKMLELGVAPVAKSGTDSSGVLPFILVEGLKPDEAEVETENWCAVAQEVALPGTGSDPAAFMTAALEYANNKCWGSLAVAVFCDPTTQRAADTEWKQLISGLRYGSVCINVGTTMGFVVTALPWGAAPGNSLHEVESGVGSVHNTYLFDHVAKGVLTAPWRPVPKPLHHADNNAVPHMMPSLLSFVNNASNPLFAFWPMTQVALHAVRG